MARKRKLDATPVEDEPIISADIIDGDAPQSANMGGFWGGSALNMLQARLEETQASVTGGILAGTIALALDPDQIEDAVGSDRVDGWQQDDAFTILKEDISKRGQKQAIRVRPADPDWRPDPASPMETDARFVIQSGRRRLEAMRQLGRKVQAVVTTEEGEAQLADLEERFKENTLRQDLSGFEELLSIGLIAEAHKDKSQTEIAQMLSVPQGEVSLGLSCIEWHDALLTLVDVANTPKREYRQILPRLKRGENPQPSFYPSISGAKSTRKKPSPPVRLGKRRATVKATGTGFTIAVKGHSESDDELRKIAREFLEFLETRARGTN